VADANDIRTETLHADWTLRAMKAGLVEVAGDGETWSRLEGSPKAWRKFARAAKRPSFHKDTRAMIETRDAVVAAALAAAA
jgi:hypothetical protein